MKETIKITLNPEGSVGSLATVTTKRLFRKPVVKVYYCTKSDICLGASWSDEGGKLLDTYSNLRSRINKAAQDEVHKRCVEMIKDFWSKNE